MHAHVFAVCRHCMKPQWMHLAKDMAEARDYLDKVPELFQRDMPNILKKSPDMSKATFSRVDEDIIRVKWGQHDLLSFTSPCEEPYASCKAEWDRFLFGVMMQAKLEELVGRMLGNDSEEQQNMGDNLPDSSTNILNQLDLPEDFFGNQRRN